jgi:S-adenosyl-L-methionine hydrolase (adenosine-forming)
MILLFTDFGLEGPYTGQVKAVLWREAPAVPVFDLFADAPAQRPQEAAYLLAAYTTNFPQGSVFLCVVDPGVGTARPAEAHLIDGSWFVGPGNGLFEPVLRRGSAVDSFAIEAVGPISASFHGRDLFAPAAGRLAAGSPPRAAGLVPAAAARRPDWPDDLPAIVYIDRYGNAMTGLRAAGLPAAATLAIGGQGYRRARTFGEVPEGTGFWYENANGLAEIAVNRGRADALPGVVPGAAIGIAGL